MINMTMPFIYERFENINVVRVICFKGGIKI